MMFRNRPQSLHAFPDALLTIIPSYFILDIKCEVKLCIGSDINLKTAVEENKVNLHSSTKEAEQGIKRNII
jgi:hypothetical protein